jgi:hypothetical protein
VSTVPVPGRHQNSSPTCSVATWLSTPTSEGFDRSRRRSVSAQLDADATGVPALSDKAQGVLSLVQAGRDDQERAAAWRAIAADPEGVTNEVKAFVASVQKRFGEEGVRAMLRADAAGSTRFDGGSSVGPEQRHVLAEMARTVAAIRSGERAVAAQAQIERASHSIRTGARLKP